MIILKISEAQCGTYNIRLSRRSITGSNTAISHQYHLHHLPLPIMIIYFHSHLLIVPLLSTTDRLLRLYITLQSLSPEKLSYLPHTSPHLTTSWVRSPQDCGVEKDGHLRRRKREIPNKVEEVWGRERNVGHQNTLAGLLLCSLGSPWTSCWNESDDNHIMKVGHKISSNILC